ncbi:MAG TPA: hypothetical protein VIH42_09445 [Thermoguttaceae bacterium]
MSQRPFRFIHAGDFHLEQTLAGVSEVPEHLRELFLEARQMAAKGVFEAALFEEAAFVLLTGDILHPFRTGPRGLIFLREQFARLAEREIAVFWAGGAIDPPAAWPTSLQLPGNVHVFPSGHIDEYIHEQQGAPIARLIGISSDKHRTIRAGDFHPDPSGLFTIGAAYGEAEPSALLARGIHCWALGGRHERSTLTSNSQLIHYCGSPQGNRPEETGVHGCTLVQVDENWQMRTSLIPTDAVRWISERILVDKETTPSDLETRLRERINSLRQSCPKLHLLIAWTIAGEGPLLKQLRHERLGVDLLGLLRSDYGYASPAAWSLSIQGESTKHFPTEWYEQETIRGDFLREIRRLQISTNESLELEPYVSEAHKAGALGAVAQLAYETTRETVLTEAALLGATLLGGEADETEEVQS